MERPPPRALGALLLVALVASAAPAAPPGGPPPALIVVAPVEKKPVAESRTYVGTVEAARRGRAEAEVAGYVTEADFEAGDEVGPDKVLARLATATLDVRVAEVKAERALVEAQVAELEAGARPQELDRARADLEAARADLATAEWKLDAVKRLRAQDRVAEEQLREAQLAVDAGRARIAGLEADLALLEAGTRPERLAAERARLAVQDAALARLEDERRRHVVRAPYPAIVVERLVEPGQWVVPGTPIAELLDAREMDVVVNVLEDEVVRLQTGAEVTIEVEALPGLPIVGRIHRMLPMADRRSRTVPVKVRLPASEGAARVKDGMFARVHLAVGEERDALVVPKDAIVLGGATPTVYVHDAEGGTVRAVPVVLGPSIGTGIVVEGPLAAGDLVVVRGNERLFPGSPVRVGTPQ